jgi:hypothetical protein
MVIDFCRGINKKPYLLIVAAVCDIEGLFFAGGFDHPINLDHRALPAGDLRAVEFCFHISKSSPQGCPACWQVVGRVQILLSVFVCSIVMFQEAGSAE